MIANGPQGCMWCGSTPLSREHLIPQWVGDTLAEISDAPDGFDQAFEWTTIDGAGDPTVYSVKRPEVVVKAVCEPCNNGWMAQLEHDARPTLEPLLRGTRLALSIEGQALLAHWAAKTVVLLDHYASDSIVVSDGDLEEIQTSGAPTGFHIRLAYRPSFETTPSDVFMTSMFAVPVGQDIPDDADISGPNSFLATLGLGHVAIAVAGGPGIANPDRWTSGSDYPLMIWPPSPDGIEWPPPPGSGTITDRNELRAFHEGILARIHNETFPRPDALRHTQT